MATLENQLDNAKLSTNCKADLFNHNEQLRLQTSQLPKRPLTVHDSNCFGESGNVNQTPQSLAPPVFDGNPEYFQEYTARFNNELKGSCPFRRNRTRGELTGVEYDFAMRYADKVNGTRVEREVKTDAATSSATAAYKEAFRSYMGRDPTEKELEEVNRLYFGFNERGEVGVIQKPHSCFPHHHISCCNRRPTKCPSQIYSKDVPHVRGARDRFPGSIPVWSSTKNLHTLISNEQENAPGHHKSKGITVPAENTMVTSKGIRL